MEKIYTFKSRRNEVFRSDGNTVVKKFKTEDAFDNETRCLQLLDGNRAPGLIVTDKRELTVTTEYIDGALLVDEYLAARPEEMRKLAAEVAKTVFYIHETCGLNITYDENFRNYLVSNGIVYRLDFEDARPGKLEEQCAQLIAFALMYPQTAEAKLAFSVALQDFLQVNREDFIPLLKPETAALAERWNADCPDGILAELIERINTDNY